MPNVNQTFLQPVENSVDEDDAEARDGLQVTSSHLPIITMPYITRLTFDSDKADGGGRNPVMLSVGSYTQKLVFK